MSNSISLIPRVDGWKKLLSLAIIVAGFISSPALAQFCGFSSTGLNFGNVNGQPTAQQDTSGTISGTCIAGTGTTIRLCVSIPVGSGGQNFNDRRMLNGGAFLQYNIYKDPARTDIYGARNGSATPGSYNLFMNNWIVSFTIPIYGRLNAGQTGKPVGVYASNFTGGNEGIVRSATTNVNCNTYNTNADNFTFTVQANLVSSCTITANNMSFGTVGTIDTLVDTTTNISVTCPNGVPYAISLSGGTVNNNIANRQMGAAGAAPGVVNYQLYTNAARTTIWGNGTTGATVTGTGNGVAQNIPVYGRLPVQPSRPAGIYQDTITATLDY